MIKKKKNKKKLNLFFNYLNKVKILLYLKKIIIKLKYK